MKTESHSIHDVLAKNATSFFIPPFQRAYAWGKPEIERFFSDVTRIIDSDLDSKQQDKLEHFFGTLVIKEEKDGFANKSIIVDGQQRLTTTLVFLIALRDSEAEQDRVDLIHQNYLTNNSSKFQDKIKLKQVTKDWDSYRALVNGGEPKLGTIKTAYELFKKFILEKKKLNPEVKFEHYIIAIQRMNVAVIFLDERPFKGEDPQIIFETLNSLGKPLSLSDLVRNFVLLKMNSESQSHVYEKVWHPKIEKVLDNDTSKFFRDYLQYKKAAPLKVVSDNNTKELYQQFKEYVDDSFDEHNDFVHDIIRYVKCYKWIITEVVSDIISHDSANDKEIKELLRIIFHDIKAEAFKPLVLGLLEYHQYNVNELRLNDEGLKHALETIKIYLIRRRILGLTQGENKTMATLSKRIPEIVLRKVTILELLTNMIYRLRLPNDIELGTSLATMNFYKGLSKYSKLILGKMEERNTKVSVDFRNKKVTIEHIMPQKINDSWKAELGENYDEIHKTYLHNIGNLILTEFNSEIGNKSFEEKKRKLETSSLHYRLDIIKRVKWDEHSIKEHQANMINWLLKTFPLPPELREASNWKTNESSSLSPLETGAGELAEGNKPVEIHINDKVLKARTWQDVFIEFLKHLKNNSDKDFQFIIDNQAALFNKEQTILKWRTLKDIIDLNIGYSNRYKTFDGKVWDKVKDLDDDLLFVHINISASRCIQRIARIMEEFNMQESSVIIKLK